MATNADAGTHTGQERLAADFKAQGGHAALTVVDNVAAFLLLASHHPRAWGEAFNIEDELPVSWQRYFHDLAGLMGVQAPKSIPRALAYAGARVVIQGVSVVVSGFSVSRAASGNGHAPGPRAAAGRPARC